MQITDTLLLDAPRLTGDGFLVATAKVAKVGVQEYSGAEAGRPNLDRVRVYRPPESVFDAGAMRSFAWRPVTHDHPPDMVDSQNWKKYAVGQTGDEVARDGDAIRVPLVLMDASAIDAVQSGKRELSMGYTTDLEWIDGKTPEGLPYDAIQRNIRANHLAVVDRARGGPTLRIGDDEMTTATKVIHFDGLPVEITDAGATLVDKLVREKGEIAGKFSVSEKTITDAATAHAAAIAAKDGEIAAIKAQVLTDEQIEQRALALVQLWGDAKMLAPTLKLDGLKPVEIRKAAVTLKLGEAACKDQAPAFFDGAFPALVVQAKANGGTSAPPDALRDAIRTNGQGGGHGGFNSGAQTEAGKAWDASRRADETAWMGRKTA